MADLKIVNSGGNPPQEINVLIEIPKGSRIKYEIDKKSGFIFVDRFLYTAMSYPFNYGFIPGTLSPDGDPVDVLVISQYPVQSGTIIPASPIAYLEMEDEAGVDAKILAVPLKKIDPFYGNWQDLKDIPENLKNQIKHFFEHYKELEPGKWVKVKNWQDKKRAEEEIKKSLR